MKLITRTMHFLVFLQSIRTRKIFHVYGIIIIIKISGQRHQLVMGWRRVSYFLSQYKMVFVLFDNWMEFYFVIISVISILSEGDILI